MRVVSATRSSFWAAVLKAHADTGIAAGPRVAVAAAQALERLGVSVSEPPLP
jgi:hypothetical protein